MILRYSLQSLRAHGSQFVAIFIALSCAAAALTACGALLETGLRGSIATERFAGVPIVVAGDQNVHHTSVEPDGDKTKVKHKSKPLAERVWLPSGTARTIAAVSGVRAAAAEVSFPAYLITGGRIVGGPDGSPSLGHGWGSANLTPFGIVAGRAPASSHDVVIDRELARRARLRVGARVVVQATSAPTTFVITGITAPASGDFARQSSVFFSDTEAITLSGRGGESDAIGVWPQPGVTAGELGARIERAVPGAVVHTGSGRGPVEFLDAADVRLRLVSTAGALAATALLVAILVTASTLDLLVQQRERELALLRAVAATPRQARRLIGVETVVVGLLAAALGAVVGLRLARFLLRGLIALNAVPPHALHPIYSVVPAAGAILITVLGAWAAARLSARRVTRVRPGEALTGAILGRAGLSLPRGALGAACLAGGAVLLALLAHLHVDAASTPVTYVTVLLLSAGVASLGPAIVRGAGAATRPLLGYLARAHIRANAARVSQVVAPLVLLVALAGTVLFLPTTLGDGARKQAAAGTRADWIVTAQKPGVPPTAEHAVRSVPGVTGTAGIVHTTVRVGLDKFPAQGIGTSDLTKIWNPDVSRGSLAGFGSADVALSTVAADQLDRAPGDALTVTLGDHTRIRLHVRAVYRRGLGFGDLTMAQSLVADHVDDPLPSAILVSGPVPRTALQHALRTFAGVAVLDGHRADKIAASVERANAKVSYLLMGLVVALTAIAVVNTLVISVLDRFGELALLRAVGATRRQARGMLLQESLWISGLSVVLGSAVAAGVLTAFSIGMTDSATPSIDVAVAASVGGLAVLLAVISTAASARAVLRARRA